MSEILLKNASIFLPQKEILQMDIITKGPMIKNIAPKISEGYSYEIDMAGYTIYPGMFNAHVHVVMNEGPISDEDLKSFALKGVTTIRDMGISPAITMDEFISWRGVRSIAKFPQIISFGKFITCPECYGAYVDSVPLGYLVDSPETAKEAVRDTCSKGFDGIKTALDRGSEPGQVLPLIPEDIFRSICSETKNQGKNVAAHVAQAENLDSAVEWGLMEDAHIPVEGELTDELIRKLIDNNVTITPTLSIFDMVGQEMGIPIVENAIRNTELFYKAGGRIAMGTDFMGVNEPWHVLGIPVHEMRLMGLAGMTIPDIIQAATKNSAYACGILDKVGTLEVGKAANLIAVKGSVSDTFEEFDDVPFVMNRGEIIKISQILLDKKRIPG